MEQVIWKAIKGYEGFYEVSNAGQIRSLDMYLTCRSGAKRLQKGRIKPLYKNNRGYITVNLCKDRIAKRKLVHRLVAEAFIDNKENKPQVNHIDGDISNNNASNLEWVTDNENKSHSSIERGGTQRPKKSVVVTKKNTGEKFFFEGVKIAERTLNLDHGTVMKILRGKQISHRGYCIAYANGGDA
jgi:hypothetical protein